MSLRLILLLALLVPWAASAQDACAPERLVKVSVQPSAFPSLPGQTVTFRVFVEPVSSSAEPTGFVQVSDGATDLGVFTPQGQFTFTRTFNESGAHLLTAAYSGDMNYCSVSAVFGQQVDHLTATITLSASAATVGATQPVTLTAQVVATPPAGVAAPLGPVQFLEGARVLGTAALVNGKASLSLATLPGGVHQIAAVLTGDVVWFQVRSATVTVTGGRTATTTALTAVAGLTNSTLTATVAPAADGTVQFVDTVSNAVFGSVTLPANGAAASVNLSAAQVLGSVGHPLAAVYSGSASFAPSTSNQIGIPVALNSTGAASAGLAAGSIVSIYGWNLAQGTAQAEVVPLPETLAAARVTVTDSAGTERSAGLYLVSPGQLNLVFPPQTAPGTATIAIAGASPRPPVVPIRVAVTAVAPGLYTTTSDGKGLPAAQLIRVRPDGSQSTESVTSAGIRIGADTVYLVLYGTGIRNRSALPAVTCAIGGVAATVSYAGPQSESPGLDQVNVLVPAALAGKGDVGLTLSVDGQPANPVSLKIIG